MNRSSHQPPPHEPHQPQEHQRPRLRHIPFRRLGTTEMHLRYLEDDPDLAPFLGPRPRDAADLLRRAPLNARRLVPGAALAKAMLAYAERHGAPEGVLENARALGDDRVYCVVTGQQPGLFGGPLYTAHKAATAVRLARELSALPGAPRVVPVFWNHSDDHDLDEANRAFLVNANQDLQRLRLDIERTGEALRDIGIGHDFEKVMAAAGDLLPQSDFREWALGIFRPRHPDEHLGAQLARLLFALFGEHGLLVIEPRDLPEPAFDVLPKWFEAVGKIRGATRSTGDHLADLGLDVTLDPGATLMFQRSGSRRVALADDDDVGRPSDLSPGVLLRPLWQDACLPTIGAVVGPGELGYMAIAGPVYKTLGVPIPSLVPRASLTLVEPSLQKLLARFGWDIPDLAQGPEVLARTLTEDEQGGVEDALADLAELVKQRLGDCIAKVGATDQGIVGALDRARSKVAEELQKASVKVRNSRQNREGTGLRQIRRLCSNLRPKGRPQERVLSVLPFLVAHGPALANDLLAAADPFSIQHGVVEL